MFDHAEQNTAMSETVELDGNYSIATGSIPSELIPDYSQFQELWDLHPNEYSEVTIHGKTVKVPRWDRAYEKDYPFSNQIATAHRAPSILKPFLDWAIDSVDERINGLFVNWHDGILSHYHGKHRDSVKGLLLNTPIITVSLGEERVFRMRPYPAGKPIKDFVLDNGDYVVIPWNTNQHWTHEVPRFVRYKNRRISVTMRAFE